MTPRAKKLLIVLFISLIILAISWIFRPDGEVEVTPPENDQMQEIPQL